MVFAAGSTGYIFIGVQIEERDLVRDIGDAYVAYRRRVPMLVPFLRRGPAPADGDHATG